MDIEPERLAFGQVESDPEALAEMMKELPWRALSITVLLMQDCAPDAVP